MRDGDIYQIHLQFEEGKNNKFVPFIGIFHASNCTLPLIRQPFRLPPSPRGKAFGCLLYQNAKLQFLTHRTEKGRGFYRALDAQLS